MAFVGLAFVAGFITLCQVVLTPDFLGLTTWTGRFGEGLGRARFSLASRTCSARSWASRSVAALAAARRDSTRACVGQASRWP